MKLVLFLEHDAAQTASDNVKQEQTLPHAASATSCFVFDVSTSLLNLVIYRSRILFGRRLTIALRKWLDLAYRCYSSSNLFQIIEQLW